MGRKIPIGDNSSFYPAISFPFLIASMVATIAIITGLCGTRFRKKSSPPPSSSPDNITETPQITQPSTTLTESETGMDSEEKTEEKIETPEIQKPLKLPPQRMLNQSSSYSCHNSNSVSGTEFNSSMSFRVPRSMSVAKSRSKREEKPYKKKEKFKADDSVWMKTIILGEKCRVPDNEDDPVLYDDKGKRISTFHTKNPSSLPPSRTCSVIDPQAIPG